jgi:hypothetical protein
MGKTSDQDAMVKVDIFSLFDHPSFAASLSLDVDCLVRSGGMGGMLLHVLRILIETDRVSDQMRPGALYIGSPPIDERGRKVHPGR